MKKKSKIKYTNGGDLIGAIAPQLLNLVLPGLGTVASPLINGTINQIQQKQLQTKILTDHFNSMSTSTNPYGNYKDGGKLNAGWDNLIKYEGASHDNGGIQVNAQGIPTENGTAEVEGGETALRLGDKTFIFSKHLII